MLQRQVVIKLQSNFKNASICINLIEGFLLYRIILFFFSILQSVTSAVCRHCRVVCKYIIHLTKETTAFIQCRL